MDDRRLSTGDIRRLQEFADLVYPGHQGGELVLWLPGRNRAVLPVRTYIRDFGDSSDESEPQHPLSEIEQAIMTSVRSLAPGERPTGETLAELAQYPFNGRFREALAGLVRRGLLKNRRPGYTL